MWTRSPGSTSRVVSLPALQLSHPVGIDVEGDHGRARSAEGHGHGETHIAQPDDRDFPQRYPRSVPARAKRDLYSRMCWVAIGRNFWGSGPVRRRGLPDGPECSRTRCRIRANQHLISADPAPLGPIYDNESPPLRSCDRWPGGKGFQRGRGRSGIFEIGRDSLFKIIDRISKASPDALVNEDAIGATSTCAWVIDGATGVSERPPMVAGTTDAGWLAGRLNTELRGNFDQTDLDPIRALEKSKPTSKAISWRSIVRPGRPASNRAQRLRWW